MSIAVIKGEKYSRTEHDNEHKLHFHVYVSQNILSLPDRQTGRQHL